VATGTFGLIEIDGRTYRGVHLSSLEILDEPGVRIVFE